MKLGQLFFPVCFCFIFLLPLLLLTCLVLYNISFKIGSSNNECKCLSLYLSVSSFRAWNIQKEKHAKKASDLFAVNIFQFLYFFFFFEFPSSLKWRLFFCVLRFVRALHLFFPPNIIAK